MRKTKSIRAISLLLIAAMLLSVLELFTQSTMASEEWRSKIDADLQEIMVEKGEEDLIEVYLWRKEINQETINQALALEKGMNPEIYENEDRFQEEIVPQLTKEIEARVGVEEAHKKVELTLTEDSTPETIAEAAASTLGEDGFDRSISLVDRAVDAEVKNFIMAKREIVKRETSASNNTFVEKNIKNEDHILFNSWYMPVLIVKATKGEIEAWAKKDDVVEISLHETIEFESSLNQSLEQIGADRTKSSDFNSGTGYRGTGVTVGILEIGSTGSKKGGRFISSAPQLAGAVAAGRLMFEENYTVNNEKVAWEYHDHATMVTSIIVGQAVTVNGRTYEGVAPLATVYQMPAVNDTDLAFGIERLIYKGATVINVSYGIALGNTYSNYDRVVDNVCDFLDVTFVAAAGNNGNKKEDTDLVNSPGKAVNGICVGNAYTKSSANTALNYPYSLSPSSSFLSPPYLPNKPDIVAPGSNISYVRSSGTIRTDSGTSFAAPIVTGVIAQMMQRNSSLKRNPTLVKEILLTAVYNTKISTSGNPLVSDSVRLREKSGIGLVDAYSAVLTYSSGRPIYVKELTRRNEIWNVKTIYLVKNFDFTLVLTFNRPSYQDSNVTSISDLDDLDLSLVNTKTGRTIAYSHSSRNNVEVIHCIIPKSGNYTINVTVHQLKKDPVTAAIVF